ncbi:metallophosphoesterase [Patescibacteria group bacterium]|nr:metallophosphoesterase [Patescibacteria group bacterium]
MAIPPKLIAHLSDLHIGYSPERLRIATAIRDRLREARVDLVIVTGDSTEHGRLSEYAQFQSLFAEFIETNRCIVVPGNHDRVGEGVAHGMMLDQRVTIERRDGLHLVLVDTTGAHNRHVLLSHGKIDAQVIEDIDRAVADADLNSLVIVALHHHLMPQPEEYWLEKAATFFRLPFAKELCLGQDLIQDLVGRCDLILHGHRHKSLETRIAHSPRALTIFNAGSSTELQGFRLFRWNHSGLIGQPEWCVVNK